MVQFFVDIPRGEGEGVDITDIVQDVKIGKGRIIKKGKDLAILALGTRVGSALKVADHLLQYNLNITVADARFAKPIDTQLVEKLWNEHQKLIIIEEGSAGGFSSHCLHFLSSKDLLNKHDKEIKCLTMPDNFQDHASQKEQLAKAGLDTDGLMKVVSKMISLSNIKNKSITN